MTTYHHHEILVNGRPLRCNDSQISLCVEECKRSFDPMDQQACVQAVEARWAPYSNCFSGDMTVIVRGSPKPVRMRDLKEGDRVLDKDMNFVEVVGWLHRSDDVDAMFIVIEHETGKLWVTSEHLIYDPQKAEYCSADSLTSLETVYFDGTSIISKVQKSTRCHSRGVYAPLTRSGTLMVSGVHASCFASPENIAFPVSHELGKLATLPFRWHTGITSRLMPIDEYCRVLYNLCVLH